MTDVSKSWQTANTKRGEARALAKAARLPEAIAAVLISRGIATAEAAADFLSPSLDQLADPFELPDMDKAVDRICGAVNSKEKILIYGDYDADGVTSTAILLGLIRDMGGRVSAYLPNRIGDGYGLNVEPLKRCLEEHRPKLVVTVDCGTCAVEAVRLANDSKVDVVVIDHHEVSDDIAPAYAVVNPKLNGNKRTTMLAGVGVTYKLCEAIKSRAKEATAGRTATARRSCLDYVAIGTVADIVPLTGENRILVHCGLIELNKKTSAGLNALTGEARIKTALDTYHLGFLIGPRLNAAGRMGDASVALELLLTDDRSRAATIAESLETMNRERKRIEDEIVAEATARVDAVLKLRDRGSVVVAGDGWHPGVIGIVAARLCAKFHRPAVVVTFDSSDTGRGSCRSMEQFDMVEALHNCSDTLVTYGGHSMASGFTIRRDRYGEFKKRFNDLATAKFSRDDFREVLRVDSWVNLEEVDHGLLETMLKLRPFGPGNPTPVFAARGLRIVGDPQVVGGSHLKMMLRQNGCERSAIAFTMADREIPSGPMDVAFQVQRDTFGWRNVVQLNVKDFRPAKNGAC